MSIDQNELQSQLAHRRRHLRIIASQESGEDRLRRFVVLQSNAMKLLGLSPQGLQSFKRRNYHSRRARVVDGVWQPVSTDRSVPPS